MNDYVDWLKKNKITEVECMIPDNSGIPRGKILPTKKFLSSIESGGLRLPLALFKLAVSRDVTYSIDDQILNPTDGDFILKPDFNTLRTVPWYEEPTAQVICDAVDNNDNVIEVHSRGILKKVIGLYEKIGLEPVVAPEIEFYLVKKNNDPDNPLETPSGQSGRIEKGNQSYGIDAVNEFDHIFEDLYDYCETQELEVENINHEDGPAQMEINFKHGNPLDLADQVFLFKRTLRHTALKHNLYATFMAKPMEDTPGNSMHIHQYISLMIKNLKKQNVWFVFTPYLWLVLFFFVPLALIFKISISVSEWGMPPYRDLFSFSENGLKINSTLGNYLFIFSDPFYIRSYLNSLSLAFTSTVLCLLIGYPIAFYVAKSKPSIRNILLIMLIIPFWSSFLLRVYAWKVLLQGSGIINSILIHIGLISEPISMLHNHYAVILGVVYTYLPFMILPLYGYLVKFDLNLIDASNDLGAKPLNTFVKVILPLSLPGIVAGSMLVFIPVVGEYIIPEMLGGSDKLYFGKIIWDEFFVNRDWPIASALAMSGIVILVFPIIIFQLMYAKYNFKNE